jgi:hypothetical protein
VNVVLPGVDDCRFAGPGEFGADDFHPVAFVVDGLGFHVHDRQQAIETARERLPSVRKTPEQ